MRLLALPLLLAAAPALAQAAPPDNGQPAGARPPVNRSGQPTMVVEPVAMVIAGFDADGDGAVTRDELARGVARSFAAVAKGRSALGYIDYSDWAELWLGDRNALPSPFDIDTNGDDQITLAELQAKFAAVFARLDASRDGKLTHAELLTIRALPGGERPEGGSGRRGRRGPPGGA